MPIATTRPACAVGCSLRAAVLALKLIVPHLLRGTAGISTRPSSSDVGHSARIWISEAAMDPNRNAFIRMGSSLLLLVAAAVPPLTCTDPVRNWRTGESEHRPLPLVKVGPQGPAAARTGRMKGESLRAAILPLGAVLLTERTSCKGPAAGILRPFS